MSEKHSYIVCGEDFDEGGFLRLDKYLASKLRGYSRSYIQKLIGDGLVWVNGLPARRRRNLKVDDTVVIEIPEPVALEVVAENIPLDVVYEDSDIIVVNKPVGMVVHPVAYQLTGTLVNALLYRVENLSGIGGVFRPGIVHRLDRDTTGLLMVAKNDFSHRSLSDQLKSRTVVKKYQALLVGEFREESGVIDIPIGRHPVERKKMSVHSRAGKPSKTSFCVIERLNPITLMEITLHTGRTHQIRTHFAFINRPVFGDHVYGGKLAGRGITLKNGERIVPERQYLHACYLEITHPRTEKRVSFQADFPEDFSEVLKKLRGNS